MIYKNFRIIIFIHILLIVGLTLLLAFVISEADTLFAPVVIGGVLLFIVVNLIRYIEKSNRDFTHFLLSLRQGAFTESYNSGNRGKGFKELSNAMNEIAREFANLNTEKELHYQYLQALNENINVAILSFDANGKLIMMNMAAKRLLNLPSFSSLEHFKRIDSNLHDAVIRMGPEERAVVKTFIGEESYQLSVQAKEIILQGKPVRIFLLQNLNSELDAKEIEAWYQLIRVLTHEIMNSVTPIVSLTGAMQSILNNPDGSPKDLNKLTDENKEDVFSSISTIESRSQGLLKFVNAYKQYAKPLELHLEETDALMIVHRVVDLFKQDLQEKDIDLQVESPLKSAGLKVDVVLIEQVLINLIKNAIEALPDENGKIQISINSHQVKGIRISIADNGAGIDKETLSKIFIPFYTTKPKGTGIGLSLSRQIIKQHRGSIYTQSSIGKGSVFTLVLPS
jgi:two-component system, NtrC family, nitrogen regulation sensor histidine kinase NtrY